MWYATWHERFMKWGFIVDQHAVSFIDNTEGLMCHQNGSTYILTNHNYLQTYSQPSSESRQIHWAIHWCHWVTYMAESYMKDLADIKGNILTEHSLAQKTRRCYSSLNVFFCYYEYITILLSISIIINLPSFGHIIYTGIKLIISVPANGIVPNGARSSACSVCLKEYTRFYGYHWFPFTFVAQIS